MFVAAFWVANHFGAKLVLDYRDEWTQCPFDFVAKGRDDRKWEERCLLRADAVVFTTESHRSQLLRAFPTLPPRRLHLIPNGWDSRGMADQLDVCESKAKSEPGRITISHVGNLAGHTPPEEFLALMQRLVDECPAWRERLSLSFVGARSAKADAALKGFPYPDMLDVVDHVPKSEADRRMREADLLLLIAVKDLERYLPGKLFEYVAARRPILVVGHPGEASRVVEALGIGRVIAGNAEVSTLEGLLEELTRDDVIPLSRVSDWLRAHERRVLAGKLFELLDTLV